MNFAQTLQTAFFDQTSKRQEAESQLVQYRNMNVKEFFVSSMEILQNSDNQPALRQAAGTLIKGSAALQSQNSVQYWFCLDESIRKQLKNQMCEVLMCPESMARRAAADAISTICTLEIPIGEWSDFIPNLAQNANHQNQEVVKSSIMTLGYICEKFKDIKQNNLSQETLQSILMGICLGFKKEQENIEIKIISLKALRDSFIFLEPLFSSEQVLTFVAQNICENCQHSNSEIKQNALQCCIDWVKNNYMKIGPYLSGILTSSQEAIADNDEDIAEPAIEIWNTIANEYRDLNAKNAELKVGQELQNNIPNHVHTVYQQLLPLLLNNLTKTSDDDEAESKIQEASGKCLSAIIEAIGENIQMVFTNFVSNCLSQQDVSAKQAGILAFQALIEGSQNSEQIKKIIFSSLSHFVMLLQDSPPKLKENIGKMLSKVAESWPQCFLEGQNFLNDLSIMLQKLRDRPAISRHICWTIAFLADIIDEYPNSPLNMNINQVIESLFQNAIRQDLQDSDESLIDSSFMAIMNLLQKSPNKQLSIEYLKITITQFQNAENSTRRGKIQQGILATMHASLLSLGCDFQSTPDYEQLSQDIYSLVTSHFKVRKEVDTDSLYVVAALASAIKEKFNSILDDFWPYLTHGLDRTNDADLFRTSVGCLADIARACEGQFERKLDILQNLMACLSKSDFDKDLKLNIFVCIGDIILACRTKCEKYIEEFLKIFELAFQACISLHSSGQSESIDYAENLQEKLIEAYTCTIHGINVDFQNVNKIFLSNFNILFAFIQRTTEKTMHPTVDYCRGCLTLITDILNFYGNDVKELVRQPFVFDIMEIIKKYQHNQENKLIYDYALQVKFQNQFITRSSQNINDSKISN